MINQDRATFLQDPTAFLHEVVEVGERHFILLTAPIIGVQVMDHLVGNDHIELAVLKRHVENRALHQFHVLEVFEFLFV